MQRSWNLVGELTVEEGTYCATQRVSVFFMKEEEELAGIGQRSLCGSSLSL